MAQSQIYQPGSNVHLLLRLENKAERGAPVTTGTPFALETRVPNGLHATVEQFEKKGSKGRRGHTRETINQIVNLGGGGEFDITNKALAHVLISLLGNYTAPTAPEAGTTGVFRHRFKVMPRTSIEHPTYTAELVKPGQSYRSPLFTFDSMNLVANINDFVQATLEMGGNTPTAIATPNVAYDEGEVDFVGNEVSFYNAADVAALDALDPVTGKEEYVLQSGLNINVNTARKQYLGSKTNKNAHGQNYDMQLTMSIDKTNEAWYDRFVNATHFAHRISIASTRKMIEAEVPFRVEITLPRVALSNHGEERPEEGVFSQTIECKIHEDDTSEPIYIDIYDDVATYDPNDRL